MAQAPQTGQLGPQFYRQMGQTDMKVSSLSFGGGHLCLDNPESLKTLAEAIKVGINFIDTGPHYGMGAAQKALGQVLKEIPRSSYYLETKIGRTSKAQFQYTAAAVKELFEQNLKDLGVDYVDVTLIHDIEFVDDINILLNETLPLLEEFRKQGKTRYIGCSAYPIEPMKELVERSPVKIDIVLSYCRYTLFDDTLTKHVDFFKSRGVGLINAAVVGMGLLTGRGIPDWHPTKEPTRQACLQATQYCKENGVKIGRLALYHALQYDHVDTTLLGMCDLATLNDNIDLLKNGLSEKELKVLNEIKERYFKNLEVKHWEGVELANYRADPQGWCRNLYEQHRKK